jgi:lipooligosaccharide transport system permease protein
VSALARPLSAIPMPGLGARRLIERNVLVYRRGWMVILSGFFEPLFYLLGVGFGVGALVGGVQNPDGSTVPYQVFVAPALLAISSMNGAIYDSTINVFFKLRFAKTYDAILATPLGVTDVAVGEVAWALIRGTLYSIGFMVVMLALGLVQSPFAILAIPAAMLIGFTFASCGLAFATYMKKLEDFDLLTLIQFPLFLFSGTFFPVSVYPEPLRILVQLSPLHHGVELVRSTTTGTFGVDTLVHIAFLVVLGLIGVAIASRRLEKLLLT